MLISNGSDNPDNFILKFYALLILSKGFMLFLFYEIFLFQKKKNDDYEECRNVQ